MVLCFIILHRVFHWTLIQLDWLTNTYRDLLFKVPLRSSCCVWNDYHPDFIFWLLIRLTVCTNMWVQSYFKEKKALHSFLLVLWFNMKYPSLSQALNTYSLNGHDILNSILPLYCVAFLIKIGDLGYSTSTSETIMMRKASAVSAFMA